MSGPTDKVVRRRRLPISGTRLSEPFAVPGEERMALRSNVWHPGTYLLYQRGIEYFRPLEEPSWLHASLHHRVGGLLAYEDEVTGEIVPVLVVDRDPQAPL